MIAQPGHHVIDVRLLTEVDFRALVLTHLAAIVNKLQELENASNGTRTGDGSDANAAGADDARQNGSAAPEESGAPGELEAPTQIIRRTF